jgi:hypothetical protein
MIQRRDLPTGTKVSIRMSAQLSRTSLTGFDLLALFESKWRGAQPGTKVEN